MNYIFNQDDDTTPAKEEEGVDTDPEIDELGDEEEEGTDDTSTAGDM